MRTHQGKSILGRRRKASAKPEVRSIWMFFQNNREAGVAGLRNEENGIGWIQLQGSEMDSKDSLTQRFIDPGILR